MDESNPISSPMVGGCKLTKFGSEDFPDPTLHRSIFGALQYATITRPEISFSVNKVCQFMSEPSEQHWLAAKRILRYLISTVSWGLHFQSASLRHPFPLHAYCDADWTSDLDDRRSLPELLFFLDLISSLGGLRSNQLLQGLVLRQNIEAWLLLQQKLLAFNLFFLNSK